MEMAEFIVGLASAAGAASGPIFGLLWWLERNERIANGAALVTLQKATIDANHENADAIKEIREFFLNVWNTQKMVPGRGGR
jgi:hypothetical protein